MYISYSNYDELVAFLEKNPADQYTIEQAIELADDILKIGKYFDLSAAPPVVNIAKDFGFSVFKKPNMKKNESGNIYVGGTTVEVYGKDKVIVAGEQEEYFHQRFIVAHELGHYLMDYIGNRKYIDNPGLLFSRAYLKENHNSNEELRADRFAAELLMPFHLFSAQYMRAVEESYDRNYVISYLSSFFKVKKSSVEKRIVEVMNTFVR